MVVCLTGMLQTMIICDDNVIQNFFGETTAKSTLDLDDSSRNMNN